MQVTDVTPELIRHETERFVSTVSSMSNEAVLAPSLCAGWSRGHVISHVARNADGLARVVRAGLDGTGETMYESVQKRDSDIEAGARRSSRQLTEDVRTSAAALQGQLDRLGQADGAVTVPRVPGGFEIPLRRVLFMRLNEVVVHHLDLNAGFSLRQVEQPVRELMIDQRVRLFQADASAPAVDVVTDEGGRWSFGEGAARTTVSGSSADVLLWLLRSDGAHVRFDGPVPTLPFGG